MKYLLSENDQLFKEHVESCEFPVSDFDHKAHLRLAYVYLTANDTEESIQLMRKTLIKLLKHAGIDPSKKYHETLTKAWIQAVNHFMKITESSSSADDFIEKKPMMLDSKIMMTHYSTEVLFSEEARNVFVEPNLDPIPAHAE